MENLTDYSSYVNAAYLVASLGLGALFVVTLLKYHRLKSKLQNTENEK